MSLARASGHWTKLKPFSCFRTLSTWNWRSVLICSLTESCSCRVLASNVCVPNIHELYVGAETLFQPRLWGSKLSYHWHPWDEMVHRSWGCLRVQVAESGASWGRRDWQCLHPRVGELVRSHMELLSYEKNHSVVMREMKHANVWRSLPHFPSVSEVESWDQKAGAERERETLRESGPVSLKVSYSR